MSKIKYFLIAIMAIFLASCKKELAPIKPGSTSLQGDLATYYEVVDREYTFRGDDDITIDFKKVKDGLPAPWHSSMKYGPYSDNYQLKFTITFLDKNGNILDEGELDDEASEKLANLQNGDSTKVVLRCFSFGRSTRNKAKTFTVAGTFEYGEQ